MSKIRDWRQRFHPDADFVFAKRLKLGLDPDKLYVDVGDPVDKTRITAHRLKMWWKVRVIMLAPEPELKSTMSHTGRGWFDVTFSDGTHKKVRGREKAERLCH